MKVLLKSSYQWFDATYDVNDRYIRVSGSVVYLSDILAIKDDERKKYVRCKNCGAMIPNTPEAIAAHFAQADQSTACLTCRYLRPTRIKNSNVEYSSAGNGTYTRTETSKCTLTCGRSYSNSSIDTPSGRRSCQYNVCRQTGVEELNDVFIKYPGCFDTLLTVDAINNSNWKFTSKEYDDQSTFQRKGKMRIEAVVESNGIIREFIYRYRSSAIHFMYSKKYNKIFWIYNTTYNETFDRLDSINAKTEAITVLMNKDFGGAKS